MRFVRILATILAGPLLLLGIIWFLQGINVLPGSFMTGDIKWFWIGSAMVVIGLTLGVVGLLRPAKKA